MLPCFHPAQLSCSTSSFCSLRTTSIQQRGLSSPAPNTAPRQPDECYEFGQLWSVSVLTAEILCAVTQSHHFNFLICVGQGPVRGPPPQSVAQQPFQMPPPPVMGQPQMPPPQSPSANMPMVGQPTVQMTGPPMAGPPMAGPPMAGSPMAGPPMAGPPMGGMGSPFPGPSPPGPGGFQPGPGAAVPPGYPQQAGMN